MSKESSHTPGPWYPKEQCSGIYIKAKNPRCNHPGIISTAFIPRRYIRGEWTSSQQDANLIAAAPELLEACKAAYQHYQKTGPENAVLRQILLTVILKVEGRQL